MIGLLKCLYDEEKQKSLKSLYEGEDSKTQLLIRSVVAESLKDCPKILESHGNDYILCVLSSYHKSENDTMRVFQSVIKAFDKIDFGLLTENIEFKDLNRTADESLIGIGFFRRYMEENYRRKASPSVEYYSKAGALAFHRLGYDDIGNDFDGWTSFIENEFGIISII